MKVKLNQIYFKDCLEILKSLPNNSVDLFVQDPPYALTKNKWDTPINYEVMWQEWMRVGKPNAAFVFTAQMPFTVDLVNSNRKMFRYDLIWHKIGKATGFLNAKRMPLRSHEQILVFYKSLPTYNPQKTVGEKKNNSRGKKLFEKEVTNHNYGKIKPYIEEEPTTDKYPTSVLAFKSVHPPLHPTQKPVPLMRWIIRSYSNEGDVVFDGYSGIGTVAEAAEIENRNFIACEREKEYFDNSMALRKARLMNEKIY